MKVAVNMSDMEVRDAIREAIKKKTGVDIWTSDVKLETKKHWLSKWEPVSNIRAVFSADEMTYDW